MGGQSRRRVAEKRTFGGNRQRKAEEGGYFRFRCGCDAEFGGERRSCWAGREGTGRRRRLGSRARSSLRGRGCRWWSRRRREKKTIAAQGCCFGYGPCYSHRFSIGKEDAVRCRRTRSSRLWRRREEKSSRPWGVPPRADKLEGGAVGPSGLDKSMPGR